MGASHHQYTSNSLRPINGMAAASDPVDVLRSTAGKENVQRLLRLLISGGTSVLREFFDNICSPSHLPTILSNPATQAQLRAARLTIPQWNCLYPSPGVYGKSTDFDITLLFRLLRTICNLVPPVTGWDVLPASTDHGLTADLVRIKYYRNSVYGNHRMEMSDDEFLSRWQETSTALVRIAGNISGVRANEWQTAIDKFLKDPLTVKNERNAQELKRWNENDGEVTKPSEDMTLKVRGSNPTVLVGAREEAKDLREQLEEIHQSIASLTATSSQSAAGKPQLNLFLWMGYPQVTCVEHSPCIFSE